MNVCVPSARRLFARKNNAMQFFKEQKSTHAKWIVLCLFIGAFLGVIVDRGFFREASVTVGSTTSTGRVLGLEQLPPAGVGTDVDFKQFWEAWRLLKEKYYQQPLTDKSLFYGALAGLAESTGDPYTTYFEPQGATEFQQALSGKFQGIGAEIGLKDGALQIVSPLTGSPAERAGLRAGDLIVKIDGLETQGMGVDKAVTLIRGAKGTKVILNIFRSSEKKPPRDVTIVREEILIKSVQYKMLPDQIGYINITHFNEDTAENFDEAVREITKKQPKGIVLDLRNDPGGFLETSLQVAGEWVGDAIVVKERKQGKIIGELRGTGKGRLRNLPTVVLVNEGSASASEIVAGALQDAEQATLVGTKTFGKGSVQDYQNFDDGSAIKITIAEWLTPKERTINKTGLEPNVVVDRTEQDYESNRDPQLERAVAILTGTASPTNATSTAAGSSTSTRR